MRDVKFRAWDGEKMLSDGLIFCSGSWFLSGRNFEDWIPTVAPIMQYTGIKDKNGVEIYEGDIVKEYWGGVYQVRYFQSLYYDSAGGTCAGFYLDLENNGGEDMEQDYNRNLNDSCAVVGNIYENPELVEA